MSEKTPHRRPATFRLDDPGVVVMDQEDAGRGGRGAIRITPEADPAQLPVIWEANKEAFCDHWNSIPRE